MKQARIPAPIFFAFLGALLLTGCLSNPVVHIKDDAPWYFPAVLEVEPGTTVTWDGSMAAVVHPIDTISSPVPVSSGHFTMQYSYRFDTPGIYHYFCPIHPYMQGFIAVGTKMRPELLPLWLKSWPPATADDPIPSGPPATPGVGEVWVDAQFQNVPGKDKPGVVHVIDATTWQVTHSIGDKRLNNPHNLWLSKDGNYVLQTNWFDKYLSVIDRHSKLLLKHIYVGESPAHVMTMGNDIYVTLQGADGIAILDGDTYSLKRTLRTIDGVHGHGMMASDASGRGPHGNWMDANETRMALANTEGGSLYVYDLRTHEIILDKETDPLPLFGGITIDGRHAWTASLLSGKFDVYDIDSGTLVTTFKVGNGPVQNVPSPDGNYILSALSGDGAVAIIDARTFALVKTLPTGAGAHGVIYGPKQGGGLYAYVSNKFVPWITVIDMDTLTVAGHVQLPNDALGGQGILNVH